VEAAPGAAIPVVLENAEAASGLALMLQQFIEQTLSESPDKQRRARGLRGEALFRAAEDENVCVHIAFRGDRVELRDTGGSVGARSPGAAEFTADFLSIAHLTSGRASPLALYAQRKLRARFRLRQLPFLLNMLRFMQTAEPGRGAAGARRLWLAAAIALVAAAVVWLIIA
jgi:hypothetical protein